MGVNRNGPGSLGITGFYNTINHIGVGATVASITESGWGYLARWYAPSTRSASVEHALKLGGGLAVVATAASGVKLALDLRSHNNDGSAIDDGGDTAFGTFTLLVGGPAAVAGDASYGLMRATGAGDYLGQFIFNGWYNTWPYNSKLNNSSGSAPAIW